jgi:hypothetical protein
MSDWACLSIDASIERTSGSATTASSMTDSALAHGCGGSTSVEVEVVVELEMLTEGSGTGWPVTLAWPRASLTLRLVSVFAFVVD